MRKARYARARVLRRSPAGTAPAMSRAARAAMAVAATGLVSAAYQQAADAADRHRFPPPGRLADVGGRRIHLLARGEGTPAVVIVPALASNVLEWVRVQRAAATKTTVCVYDRAGVGWSDPPPLGTLTLDGMADDLHAALAATGIGPPYIIAGQSLGGIVARRFQARYPADVTGMLLVDSSHEDQSRRFGWLDRHRRAPVARGAAPIARPGCPAAGRIRRPAQRCRLGQPHPRDDPRVRRCGPRDHPVLEAAADRRPGDDPRGAAPRPASKPRCAAAGRDQQRQPLVGPLADMVNHAGRAGSTVI